MIKPTPEIWMRNTLCEIALDCDECAEAAEAQSSYGEARAWRAMAKKARAAAKYGLREIADLRGALDNLEREMEQEL